MAIVVALTLVVVLGVVAAVTSPLWHKTAASVQAQAVHPSSSPSVHVATTLTPVSAHGFDALNLSDSGNENDNQAANVLNGNSQGWSSQTYRDAELGHLKAGTGLILDMGRVINLQALTVKFGSSSGADVQIRMGNSPTRSQDNVDSMATVARGTGVGGTHKFIPTGKATGRYVVIWFTQLPSIGGSNYMAQIFTIIVQGTAASS